MNKKILVILVVILSLLIIGGSIYFYIQNNLEPAELTKTSESFTREEEINNIDSNLTYQDNLNTGDKKDISELEQQQSNERATGIIKNVYSQGGKNFLDIDYVVRNQDWEPGGYSGPAYINKNPNLRSFEISKDAEILINYIGDGMFSNKMTYAEFANLFIPANSAEDDNTYPYQRNGLWDIEITNGVVTKITENFLP